MFSDCQLLFDHCVCRWQ